MTTYINAKVYGCTETIDEFETAKEAGEMIKEYRIADPSHYYWMSQRSTKEWRNAGMEKADNAKYDDAMNYKHDESVQYTNWGFKG